MAGVGVESLIYQAPRLMTAIMSWKHNLTDPRPSNSAMAFTEPQQARRRESKLRTEQAQALQALSD
jgi:hypothetical protein